MIYAGTATSAGLSFVETFLHFCFMYALIPVPYGTEFEITCQASISVQWGVKSSGLVETFKKRILQYTISINVTSMTSAKLH